MDWSKIKETRLSPKDIDCDKSMNTNLHVMEAYTNLYRNLAVVEHGDKNLRKHVGRSLESLIKVHVERILDPKDFHLDLYFNAKWRRIGENEVSYGHDIEASWLIWEAACELGNKKLMKGVRPIVLKIAEVSLDEGFDESTGGFENTMGEDKKRDTVRIWWNQAEALNGFYNAWQMTGDERFGAAVEKVWSWIRDYQRDKENGEWFWAVKKNGKSISKELKGGNWKTVYHNSRCCMELLRRSGR